MSDEERYRNTEKITTKSDFTMLIFAFSNKPRSFNSINISYAEIIF